MSTLLIELGCEEIPARFCQPMLDQLTTNVHAALQHANLLDATNTVTPYATQRRLAMLVTGLLDKQPDQTLYQRGPAVGVLMQPSSGFLKNWAIRPTI